MKPCANEQNRCTGSQEKTGAPYADELYEFPSSVRLLSQPEFKDQVIEQLRSRLQQKAQPKLYQLLTDVYRRAGDLKLAAESAQRWKALEPSSNAEYLTKVLNQETLPEQIYNNNEIRPAPFSIIDNFLSREEREYFWQRAVNSESDYEKAGIGLEDDVIVDCYQRDTEVLRLGVEEKQQMRQKIKSYIDVLFRKFRISEREVDKIEVKLTSHTQDGFFKIHHDGFSPIDGSIRYLSWVYYFHANPKPYEGGDLVLFDSDAIKDDHRFSPINYTRYIPQDNQIIFFPSWFYHGVTPVALLSPGFSSGRFAVAGHIRCL